ncbi:hypothetical protein C5B94_13440 [Clavibacter michiganensis]|uniref:hypothetical protein n=1 Tax=Clavibacter michiganensis TaxID=28447 RepID=UPI000CE83A42|nr:hypothetical protein [Clavibacter michiganensis]PPF52198.1 hypothetical protein C5B94_13440 [Clavibacter michiganensis]
MSNDISPAVPTGAGTDADDAYAVVPATVTSTTGTATAGGSGSGSTKDTAKEQAAGVASDAKAGTQHVAGVTKDEAGKVASEARSQIQGLVSETRDQLRQQTGVQQEKAAGSLRTLSDELRDMGDRSESTGLASELVAQVSRRAGSAADYLEGRDPGTLLSDVTDFARRRPGLFAGLAVVAGVAVGRLTRSLASEAHDEAGPEATGATGTTGAPGTTGATGAPGATQPTAAAAPGYVAPAAPAAATTADLPSTQLGADDPVGVGPYDDADDVTGATPLYDETRPVDPLTGAFGAGEPTDRPRA